MRVPDVLRETRAALSEDEELTPRFLLVGVGITVAFLVSFGVISYLLVFMTLGY